MMTTTAAVKKEESTTTNSLLVIEDDDGEDEIVVVDERTTGTKEIDNSKSTRNGRTTIEESSSSSGMGIVKNAEDESKENEEEAESEMMVEALAEVEAESTGVDEDAPIDLKVRNVVTMFHTCAHIDLRQVAFRMCNVIYDRSKGVVEKSLRSPYACIKIWSSGKVLLAGCRSEQEALVASRRVARLLQKILGPKVRFASYRVTNIMATCRLPFAVKIDQMAREHPKEASYEPELNTGLLWKSIEPKSTVRVHATGSIIVTGALSSSDILQVLTDLYPILEQFGRPRLPVVESATPAIGGGGQPEAKRRKVKDERL